MKKVLDAREAEIKKVIKRETDIAELEAAAQATDDADLRLVWLVVWLLPVLVLAGGLLVTRSRLRACQAQLLEVDRGH